MARKRFVTSEISTDRKVARLAEANPIAAALWPWFITGFDDWGRMSADPIEVKLTIFPAFPYTSDEIAEIIQLYHKYEIAYHYEVDGKPYLAVNPNNWFKYQTYIGKKKIKEQKSRHPEPVNAPWQPKEKADNTLATINVAKQQSATINVPSPSPSPSPSKDSTSSDVVKKAPAAPTPFDDIVSLYHEYCPSLPKIRRLSEKRKREIRTRWRADPSRDTFKLLFRKTEASDFLSGRNGKWAGCNLDWLLNESNMLKVLEGTYDNKGPPQKGGQANGRDFSALYG